MHATGTKNFDILPALKDGDSFCKTAMSRRENVPCCIHVPVVYRSAIAASPFSYSQTCSTFRTAGGNDPAARASLGGVAFADYLEDDAGLMALVFQHRLEHGPARVQRALGHPGLTSFALATSPTKMAALFFTSLLLNWCSPSLRWFLILA